MLELEETINLGAEYYVHNKVKWQQFLLSIKLIETPKSSTE